MADGIDLDRAELDELRNAYQKRAGKPNPVLAAIIAPDVKLKPADRLILDQKTTQALADSFNALPADTWQDPSPLMVSIAAKIESAVSPPAT